MEQSNIIELIDATPDLEWGSVTMICGGLLCHWLVLSFLGEGWWKKMTFSSLSPRLKLKSLFKLWGSEPLSANVFGHDETIFCWNNEEDGDRLLWEWKPDQGGLHRGSHWTVFLPTALRGQLLKLPPSKSLSPGVRAQPVELRDHTTCSGKVCCWNDCKKRCFRYSALHIMPFLLEPQTLRF